jgi:hypothetical protein
MKPKIFSYGKGGALICESARDLQPAAILRNKEANRKNYALRSGQHTWVGAGLSIIGESTHIWLSFITSPYISPRWKNDGA